MDKYLPLQADETRFYIARFPGKVWKLLPKVRKIRNALRQQGGPGAAMEPGQAMQGGEEHPRRDEEAGEGLPVPVPDVCAATEPENREPS